MSAADRRVIQSLLRAEAEINLLARCQPSNWAKTWASVREGWLAGRRSEPVFEFAPRPEFSQLECALDALERRLVTRGLWGTVWAERARELALEAQIAAAVGTRSLIPLACERFRSGDGREQRAAKRMAQCWATLEVQRPSQDPILSDDDGNPASLLCLMRAELERLRFPFPVRISSKMMARAAVDDTSVWLKPRVRLLPTHAKRIVAHEVLGHVVRRFNGRHPAHLPFRCGVAGADLDEEGRALWIEHRLGLLDASRKVELGRRHLAACACREGATFCEVVESLTTLGTPLDDALTITMRVWRGGGIAREIIYLTGYLRATRLLGRHLELDEWMKRGRLSFEIAARLGRGDLELSVES